MFEIPKAYNPKETEDKIYMAWEKSGFFNPDNLPGENIKKDKNGEEETYTIVLPPPNITSKLHLGHAAMLAIEDLLIRYHRMKGYRTLWIPGTDHAAIATQNVVEKKLLKEEKLTRHDLGREEFLKKVWEYLEKTQAVILNQTKKMGASLDWSREAFTLDKQREKAVRKMFVEMYKAGVIYRGERIVNWCPRCQSTLADDEVEYKEQKTKLHTFKYSKDFPFAIATTRPETKLGDTAVAVNPKDKRYQKYIGKVYEVDFCGIKLKLKIIADRHVEMDFGTGALGVTPAHSMADWQMAEENNLEIIKVINEDGKIRNGFGDYSGKPVLEAREMIVKRLKENGLLKTSETELSSEISELSSVSDVSEGEEIKNNLSLCYRCGTAIEPLPSKQWFINVNKKLERLGNKSLKEKAIEAAKNKSIEFIPERFEKRYLDWMENLHDWCISRQIWFGHRIPVWYRKSNNNTIVQSMRLKKENQEIYVGIEPPKGEGWIQDEDSLDTWFSSGMWTFSTLGWPDNFKDNKKSGDLKKFHPTQVLETGYEILTLWVSRMVIMSLFALKEIPFENVYLHGMLLDKHGKKMSKSKRNGIDPLEMIDKFGTDAVRLSLLIGNTPGNDVRFSEEKIEGQRNFVNKLWNISRFIIANCELRIANCELDYKNLSAIDLWILKKMLNLIFNVNHYLMNYNFSAAGEKLREFSWNDFADWYLEASKIENNKQKEIISNIILQDLLRLWHPFIPFVTEAIWREIQETDEQKFLIIEKWPIQDKYKKIIEKTETAYYFEPVMDVIKSIRSARAEYKIEPSKKINAVIYAGNKDEKELFESQSDLIKNLRTGIDKLEIKEKGEKIKDAVYSVVGNIEIYLTGVIDKEKEKKNLEKEINNLEKYLSRIENKLNNKNFIANAPKEIIDKEKEKYQENTTKLEKLKKKSEFAF
ncbi:MAG: valine--tRNA ligase [Patescibacteria group bacterium]|nr:valine--tRNA ligase [Patescibacteria group bacterium]